MLTFMGCRHQLRRNGTGYCDYRNLQIQQSQRTRKNWRGAGRLRQTMGHVSDTGAPGKNCILRRCEQLSSSVPHPTLPEGSSIQKFDPRRHDAMRGRYQYLSSILLAVAFLVPALTTGCATGSYRVYDPYRNQYHRWDNNERIYYNQWVVENHHDGRDYRRLDRDQQRHIGVAL